MDVLVLGAGQLARMMALAGAPLNINVNAYDVRTGNVVNPVTQQIVSEGLETAIAGNDAITAEFEHITPEILSQCQASGRFFPGENAILTGGDRRIEKALLDSANVANAAYQLISSFQELESAVNSLGLPLILKSALDGYDGKGQWRVKADTDLNLLWQELEQFLAQSPQGSRQCIIAERFIAFKRELSVIGARNARGETKVYPLSENIHHEGILAVTLVKDIDSKLQAQAEQVFSAIANKLEYVGVLAIEFFEFNGQLLVNEIAPRVHNSGHWTQQGAPVCQFENHLRAVANLPLGSTEMIYPTVMINLVGEVNVPDEVMSFAHVHWYDKAPRPGRKIGHINLCAPTNNDLANKLIQFAQCVDEAQFPALNDAIARLSV